ncbi:MAG: caspase family protein [Isosphaeraceae bacterium]|nr:caspase family protein [Isosphaeraceae bacterium]
MHRVDVRITAALALLLAALSAPLPSAAQTAPAKGRQWALLIGVEKYQKARPLAFTINDVKVLSKTLHERNGIDDDALLAITDDALSPRLRPTRANMLEEIPRWLSRIGRDDRLIVYFSGHGFRDPAGKLYLAPIDIDPKDPASTGLPVEWFRQQVADCKADFKLLVLDACHSGSEKGEDDGSKDVASKDIGEQFKSLERVVTLASSTGEEGSLIWDDKEQSLYSYWLNQGLKGHADADANGAVDIDELNNYVYKNVVRTSKSHFPRKQTPVRIVRSGVEGTPVVVRVKPSDLKTLLNDMAEQLTLAAGDRKVKKVGVLEFSSDSARGELLGANFGTLGRWCADWMERRLMEEGEGSQTVTNGKVLQAALAKENVGLDDLSNPDRLKQLSQSMHGLPALAQGTFRNRTGRVVTLQCRLFRLEDDEVAGSAGGVALLNESEWAMLGKSAALSPADRIPPPPSFDTTTPPKDPQDATVAKLDEKGEGPHPMTNPSFELPVRIYVNGKERQGVAKGNNWYVPLQRGETYEIYVENRAGQPVCMKLLVDGLNTLPDLEMAKTKGVATYLWGQHVNLADARHYVLDPATLKTPRKIWRVNGFITETGTDGKVRDFVVSTAEKSLAAKRKFTDQMGLITAAFYDAVPTAGPLAVSRGATVGSALGTEAGTERSIDLPENEKYKPGKLRAVVNIYYSDPGDSTPPPAAPPAPARP